MKYPKSVYLANQMRGHDQYNFPWFDLNRDWLTQEFGVSVISPADIDRAEGLSAWSPEQGPEVYERFVRRDVDALIEQEAIALGPDWEKSTGATAEYYIARWLNRPVWYVDAATYLFVPEGYSEGF